MDIDTNPTITDMFKCTSVPICIIKARLTITKKNNKLTEQTGTDKQYHL